MPPRQGRKKQRQLRRRSLRVAGREKDGRWWPPPRLPSSLACSCCSGLIVWNEDGVVWFGQASAAVELREGSRCMMPLCNIKLSRVVAEMSECKWPIMEEQRGGFEQPKTRVSRPYERTWSHNPPKRVLIRLFILFYT